MITSTTTGLAHFCLHHHLFFPQGECVYQVKEGYRCHQGGVAFFVHAMLIHKHHAEGVEWYSQQEPKREKMIVKPKVAIRPMRLHRMQKMV